ncbi:MAG TPA: chromosome segregation protein SMC [Ignavibacteriaceae bacterium]|nr:chromosome segregation protein SMC [Ignavibacteriaceae bacterium]
MYLSKLEIFGFKSFAQKTLVNFNQGVTSIVGPNGCGKTNIVDAIRWCLGEQRSGTLRSDKMENVIFNGTSNKKPMGMAEVSLTIHNNKGILPTEYSEVTITRRIFRSGESEYLLNKNICRLKDITNLFMDTGIGSNAYSVIELKMVETILNNKTDERRVMFEEAAGVNKYKLRRRLALKKLDDVKSDLTRVNDIVSEVEKKVNSLERQAKRADKYNKVSSTLRELELELAERELFLFNFQRNEAKQSKEESFQNKINLDSELAKLDDEIKIIKQGLTEIEYQLKIKRSELNAQTEKIFNVQNNVSVSEERKSSLERNTIRFQQELEELTKQHLDLEKILNDGSTALKEFGDKIESKESEQTSIKEKLDSLRIELEEKRNFLKAQSELLLDKFKEITGKENELSNVEKSLEAKNNSIGKLNDKIQSLTSNIAKTVGYLEELNQEKKETEEKLAEAEAHYLKKQADKEKLEKDLNSLKEKELEIKSVINNIKDKINFIQNLIDTLEGVSKGAKALLENNDWANGQKVLLAHIGNSQEEYRYAIEASLKNNLNNIIVESLEDLKNGIEYLKNHDVGKASFSLSNIKENKDKGFVNKISAILIKRKSKKLVREKGFLGWAKDYIQTESKWRVYFDKILIKTVIVDSLDVAFELSEKYPDFNFATLNGDYLDKTGIIEAGSAPRLDDSLFGRKQLLEKLKDEYPQRENELETLRREIQNIEAGIDEIDLKVLSERGRLLVNDLANVEKQIAQFEFEMKKATDEIEKTRQEIQDLVGESNRLDTELTELHSLLSNQVEEKQKADTDQRLLEENFKNFEIEFNSVLASQNKLNLELERVLGEKKNTENAIRRANESIDNIRKSIAKREFDISSSQNEIQQLIDIISEKKIEQESLELGKQILSEEEGKIDSEYKIVQLKISEIENRQRSLRKERDVVSEAVHSSEMKLNELAMKISSLRESVQENYSLNLELKEFEDNDAFDFKQRMEEVHSLKQQIKNLGPINLLAYSEYEEEKERFEFLNKQRNDLIESEKDIVKTIEEININAQTLFMETFEKIRTNFINIFRGLFNPGDEADLRLEENADPLEGKIEIIAKPKGKRPTSIELLSGGEKTLTAIALLFAIYLVKPSPFCILDEIDAPLDDANIDRFTKIIHDFSKDTQFIVVTHNKRTMEAANTLYGVTMQEEGISKLVSVRFNEDLSFVS